MRKITALIIMDGYGLSKQEEYNAVGVNCSPYINYLMKSFPSTTLYAHGEYVGLPHGQMGNSEVGHLNIGAGRVVYQDLDTINKSIEDGDFYTNQVLIDACNNAKGHALHLFGLVSNGGVHSSMEHIYSLLRLAKQQNVEKCYIHAFMDGRDTAPNSGIEFIRQLQQQIDSIGIGEIATVCGRYYAMDRDNRWQRVEKAYDMLTLGKGEFADSVEQAVLSCYDKGITDEFILPTVILKDGKPTATVRNDDSVIFFNFRPDRGREMTKAFTLKAFDGFSIKGKERNVHYVTMTKYDETFTLPIAFGEKHLKNTFGEYLAEKGLTQLRIAETEKYAHVTFFFNGGVEKANEGETRVLIPSPSVATYDLQPEMSANYVTDRAIAELSKDKYDVMILNFANCDMVGHTGDFNATKTAVATVDNCVRKVVEYILSCNGRVFVTADHGNAELMEQDGHPFTAHTTNLVPFIYVEQGLSGITLDNGSLCDIVPTMIQTMGLEKPQEMTGNSLIRTE